MLDQRPKKDQRPKRTKEAGKHLTSTIQGRRSQPKNQRSRETFNLHNVRLSQYIQIRQSHDLLKSKYINGAKMYILLQLKFDL